MGLANALSCEAGSLSCCVPNPHGLFQSEVCLGYVVCFTPRRLSGLSVRECGAAGSASGQTACPVPPTLHQSRSRHGHASPVCPGCPSPPLLPVWMNVIFYFLGVGFPCRSIFCQFWLCDEAQCVYLCLHLGSLCRCFLCFPFVFLNFVCGIFYSI